MNPLKTLLEILAVILLGILAGYALCFHSYKPEVLMENIKHLSASSDMLKDGYTKQFSKHFLEGN